jgi:hypothetical protein
MMSRFDIFSAAMRPFADAGETADCLRAARDLFGVMNLSYWFLGASSDVPDRMSWFSTYDEGYVEVYLREVTPLRDRAFQLCFRRLLPLDWAEIRKEDLSVENIHLMAERFGIGRHGVSIPIREPGVGDAMFSVNFDCEDRHWNELRSSLANDVHLFAHYFHLRMKNVIAAQAATQIASTTIRRIVCERPFRKCGIMSTAMCPSHRSSTPIIGNTTHGTSCGAVSARNE